MHGSIRSARCHQCSTPSEIKPFLSGESCKRCGGKLRPNVVLFGEALPDEAWDHSLAEIKAAD
ncbi:Sir2 family NAD-dependent protein deacetylase, partial [Acinetobacter baumannii]